MRRHRLGIGVALLRLLGYIMALFSIGAFAQTPYYGPTSPEKGLVSIQVEVFDSADLGGAKIVEVEFNKHSLELKPAGLHGYRGGGGFKLSPGSYPLDWDVSSETGGWPRTVHYHRNIPIQMRDGWLQITIRGNSVEIQ